MGSRNTVQRAVVLEAVNELKIHPAAEAVFEFVKKVHPSISRSTVYRNLDLLSRLGEIQRVRVPGFADRFDYNNSSHYHAVCEKCGKVSDVVMPFLNGIEGKIFDSGGYNIKGHTVVFFGECSECK